MAEHANLETGVTARLLAGANTGDSTATQQLIIHCCQRLETLARKMLRDFPRVKRWEDTADIFQNASMRLMRALEDVKPETTRHFYALAALQIRRELLDMARRYQGERGDAKSVTPLPMADHPKEVIATADLSIRLSHNAALIAGRCFTKRSPPCQQPIAKSANCCGTKDFLNPKRPSCWTSLCGR